MIARPLTVALIFDVLYALMVHRQFNQHEPSVSWRLLLVLAVPLPLTWVLMNHAITFPMALLTVYVSFFTTLFASIVLYRLSPFHPLAKYPGPILCKVSQLRAVITYSSGKAHRDRKLLHDQYGPIVRIGPNELSVIDKDMLPYILGSQGMPKGPLFEGRQMSRISGKNMEQLNLITTRDLRRHAVLRKAWNRAFSSAPLKDYEELMFMRARQLINSLKTVVKEQDGLACVDIATWIGHLVFDFMGDMVHGRVSFGGGFELMRDGDTERLLGKMSRSLYYASLCQAIPWFAPVLRHLPYFGKPMRTFGLFAFQRAKIRYDQEPDKKDLFYHLIAAYQADSQESPFPLIVSNSILAIIAGADTTAAVLKNTIFHLLANPTYYSRLREEIDATFPQTRSGSLDTEILSKLPLLNAVMYCPIQLWLEKGADSLFLPNHIRNEVLRLQPPVSTSLQRAPAKGTGGKQLGAHYIKEGTQIQVPPYVLHRDPRYFFPRPDEFWPDRWTLKTVDSQEFVLDHSAFIPFSMGPANCVGRSLAMLELRVVISLFVMHFDMEFGDGFDPQTWMDSMKDYFVLECGRLMVKLRVRERGSS